MTNSDFVKPENYISFSPPSFDSEEEMAVVDVLRSGWVTTGPKSIEFEDKVATYVGARKAVATSSCTDAMLLALRVLEIGDGDEVITTPFTFASTAHVIMHHRAKPIFVDIEPDTFNINSDNIEKAITNKTKAIMPVHYAGHPCDMDKIIDIATRHNLFVVEDAAHAIGSTYKGKLIGSIGDITCFSFYATKNLATSDGGIAVTNNNEWADRMRRLSRYGVSDARHIWHQRYQKGGTAHYDVMELGYKCNMTDICAAIGLCQLSKIDIFNDVRRDFAAIYDEAFKNHPGLITPAIKDYAKSNRHLYPLLLNLDYIKITRDEFIDELKELNIGTSILFKPLHLHSFYANTFGFKYGDFPIAESVFERIICIPISPKINKNNIQKIAEGILYLMDKHKR